MTDLPTLLKRLQEAEGPSRKLDHEIHYAFWTKPEGQHVADLVGMYTASIDAALALVERELPDKIWAANKRHNGDYWATIYMPDEEEKDAVAKTAPLAILTALIQCKLSELEGVE